MSKYGLGDIVYHKATLKRCVVSSIDSDGRIWVTTKDDETKVYYEHELMSEKEWENR